MLTLQQHHGSRKQIVALHNQVVRYVSSTNGINLCRAEPSFAPNIKTARQHGAPGNATLADGHSQIPTHVKAELMIEPIKEI
jgi:hypothetical protein